MFYYIPPTYDPNSAATNRALSFIKGFSELNIKTTVVYFRPNRHYDINNFSFPNITIKTYWKKRMIKHKLLLFFFQILYYINFIWKLKNNDKVLITGNAVIWNLILKFRKHANLFIEYTEHPEVVGIGGKFLTPKLNVFYKRLKRAKGVFVITTSLKRFFVEKGVDEKKIHIANITVDTQRFENIKREREDGIPYIGYCGTISIKKDGVDKLIESFAKVAAKNNRIELHLAGEIRQEDEGIIKNLVKQNNLANRIIFRGPINSEEMPRFLKNSLILALCRPNNKQAQYGFATKLGEYLMTERPVVITDVGDFHLFLENKKSAILVEPDNVEDFANGILWVINHLEESYTIGKKGYQVALENFSYIYVTIKIIKTIFSEEL